jgi:protocatechuate 3,4-dioxygenase beta subunit
MAMLALLLAAALGAEPAPKGLTLNGTVSDGKGSPLANATVYVRTAGPRVGVGVL